MSRPAVRIPAAFLPLLLTPFIGAGCGRLVTTGIVPTPKIGTDLTSRVKWQYSTDRGRTWTDHLPIVRGGKAAAIYVRGSFDVADASRYVGLELTHGLPGRRKMFFRLNGEPVPVPAKGMFYKSIRAIPASLLKGGSNVLEAKVGFSNRPPPSHPYRRMPNVRVTAAPCLAGLRASDLRITTGPVLGAFGENFFTVTCRTNMPARVAALRCDLPGGRLIPMARSEVGLCHRLRIRRGGAEGNGPYVLVADNGEYAMAVIRRAPDWPGADEPLRFVAMGDSRTNVDDWAAVATAALRERPYLVVFSGDMVARGRNDWQWDEQFFAPARELFANVPFYAVIGNHEENAPIYPELFYTPGEDGRAKNWTQQINGVLFIGIDGSQDFSPDSENARWLEAALAESRARFIFFFTHYPAWSSCFHGRLDELTGRPTERPVRQGQDALVPLLNKYKATAFICGHDHVYERSELPGGLTQIISGGAGAPRYRKMPQAKRQNPYSEVFASELHYCLLEVKGDTCTMKVIGLDGTVIDSRRWAARKLEPAGEPAAGGS